MRVAYDEVDIGLAPDRPDWHLPPGAFSDSRNVRYREGGTEKIRGYAQVWGDLSTTALYADWISDGTNIFWVYGDEGTVYATDGVSHNSISSISYSADSAFVYTGGAYNGFYVITDGALAPQFWDPGLGNNLQPLTNWPASTIAEVIRPYRQFLVALRVTETGTYNPRLIRWSDRANPGSVPSSWDHTDPTNLAGRTELGQSADLLVDCLPLRDANIVYKEQNTWAMEFIGAPDVFSFRQLFNQVGLLSENCVKAFRGMHFVVTDHDIILHDGAQAQSLLENTFRSWLFARIDSDNYKKSFVVADYLNREMIFAFPEQGQSFCTLALVWNWQSGKFYPRDFGSPIAFAAAGIMPSESPTTIDALVGTFDEQIQEFDEINYTSGQQRAVFFDSSATAAYRNGEGGDFAGTPMQVYWERSNVPLTKDINLRKRVLRVYPKVLGTSGDTLDVYVGTRTSIESTVQYSGPYVFTIGTDYKVDVRVSSRVVDVRFEYSGDNDVRLIGYDVEFDPDGER